MMNDEEKKIQGAGVRSQGLGKKQEAGKGKG
jgi:hypothetical protein